jgi:hypothetical protein
VILTIGSRVGPYEITAQIGAGGMGGPDGRLLVMAPAAVEGADAEHTLMFVQNSYDELRRRVPIAR